MTPIDGNGADFEPIDVTLKGNDLRFTISTQRERTRYS